MKYAFTSLFLLALATTSAVGQVSNQSQEEQIRRFRDEATSYRQYVEMFFQFYNPELATATGGISAASIKEAVVELAKLDARCKSKYPGPQNYPNETNLAWRSGDWCEIAEKRNQWARVAAESIISNTANFNAVERDLRDAFNDEGGFVSEYVQRLIYDRENWERKEAAAISPRFKELGVPIPADFFVQVETSADELKKIIDQTAPTRSFDQPKYQDAPSQAIAKRELVRMYPGIQILKIGATYPSWNVYKNSIGIPINTIRTGFALVKIPNRPYCQSRQWSLIRNYIGGGRYSAVQANFSSGQSGGVFVKCS